jgi:hypothetical protein
MPPTNALLREQHEGSHHADDDEGQGNAQYPADDAGCLALPRPCRSIFRWWLVRHYEPSNASASHKVLGGSTTWRNGSR